MARQLAQSGHRVLLSARDPERSEAAAEEVAAQTNFLGPYRLTVALLPLLRRSAPPRIVNVSSGLGGVAEMGGWSSGYRVSKAALNAMTRILSTELTDQGFLVNSVCPGFVNTDMGASSGVGTTLGDRGGIHPARGWSRG